VAYVACEPYVRRLWPEALVSWSRVLAGRLRDPLVGRDVIVGFTFASIQGILVVCSFWLAERAAIVGVLPLEEPLLVMRGGRFVVGALFGIALVSTAAALGLVTIFLLLRIVFRKTWIAGSVLCLLWGATLGLQFAGLWGPAAAAFGLAFQVVLTAIYIVVLVRFGLLATLAAFFLGGLSRLAVFSYDPSSPLFGIGVFITAVAFALGAYGALTSLAGRSLMPDTLLEA
jgi:hypothetical protein